jgi:hypothetical protein
MSKCAATNFGNFAFWFVVLFSTTYLTTTLIVERDKLAHAKQRAAVFGTDPAIGTQLNWNRKLTEDSIIILAGSCSSCQFQDICQLPGIRQATSPKLFLYTNEVSVAPACGKKLVPYDKGSVIHDQLNAFFRPRFAKISREGQLMALQSDDESPTDFLKRVEQ